MSDRELAFSLIASLMQRFEDLQVKIGERKELEIQLRQILREELALAQKASIALQDLQENLNRRLRQVINCPAGDDMIREAQDSLSAFEQWIRLELRSEDFSLPADGVSAAVVETTVFRELADSGASR